MAVQTQIQVRRGTASSWTSTNPTLAAGEIGFESDTGKIKVGTGSATWNSLTYIGAANAIQYVYTATAGQTTFSGADNNSLTLSYTVGAEQVYVNGVLQVRGTDYTATNGTSVVLTTATIASDIVTIIAYGTFTVADTYTQAQANATFPLNTSAFFAGKNKIINGDFGVWQRGTSFTSPSSAYTADRFVANAITSDVVSQQTFTPGSAPVAGYEGQYYLRYATSATAGGRYFFQKIEDVRTLAGQTVTFSFWARVNSGTATLTTYFYQQFGSGGSADVQSSTQNNTVTTSWQRFTFTITMPSVSGKTIGAGSCVQAAITFSDVSKNIDLWGWQVEAGNVATAFQTATGTIQGELAACQRYYYRFTGGSVSGSNYAPHAYGFAYSTTKASETIFLPTTMRTVPTSLDYSTLALNDGVSNTAVTNLTIGNGSEGRVTVDATVASGLTQYRPYLLLNNNSTSAYLGLSAEL